LKLYIKLYKYKKKKIWESMTLFIIIKVRLGCESKETPYDKQYAMKEDYTLKVIESGVNSVITWLGTLTLSIETSSDKLRANMTGA